MPAELSSAEPALQLFRWCVDRRPDSLALCHGVETVTYRELGDQVSRLAVVLREHARADDSPVAILLPRGRHLAVAAVAVAEAGRAALPIDPAHPPERVAGILTAASVNTVVTSREILRTRGLDAGGTVSSVITVEEVLGRPTDPAAARHTDSAGPAAPTELAYIVFTSGSTGAPKGVMVEHRSLAAFLDSARTAFAVAAGDRFAMAASPGFDAALLEIWLALTSGACLDVVDHAVTLDPPRLREWLLERRVTHMFLTTALAEPLLRLDWFGRRGSLRVLLTGGEILRRRPAPELPFRLVNCYGPTETTIITTAGVVTPGESDNDLPPIGEPIPGARVHLLDGDLRPVASGDIGELYIAGAGVARGYLGRPDLTAERFVPDPWAARPGMRMYRTGDLGRRLPDGSIEFRGRLDNQVKIRGNRVEPAEAAYRLSRHPAVAAVHVEPYSPGGQRDIELVAYLVPADMGSVPDATELRRFAARSLPDYLVPTRFLLLPRLPVTANGKVDRTALPAPETAEALSAPRSAEPEKELERRLATIWQELLAVDRVGLDDSFFDLGGHSILLARLQQRLSGELGREIPLIAVLTHHTIRDLAGYLAASRPG
ncbi:non-ribosomal peptide synthetase [Nocardia sienata]|uniref:non-ribosomal peptide synthetase n=1 Tax=Nocardia sienata TaxID=248552 RepID=UPI000A02E5AB|nr:amino acid adenylation domain-containing protein [Nocardia sienata]